MRFLLDIDLGSEAMRERGDIADALTEVAERLDSFGPVSQLLGIINNSDGDAVGMFTVVSDRRSTMSSLRDLARHAKAEGYTAPGDVVEDVADWEVY